MPSPRPSNLARLALCPGSYLLAQQIWASRPVAEKPVTSAGVRIHHALAAGDFSALPPEEEELAQRCMEYETEILERHGITAAYQEGLIVSIEREAKLRLMEGEAVILEGTADALCRYQQPDGEHLLLPDWKTGFKMNPTYLTCQMGAYAAMALQQFPQALDVIVTAYYPRLRIDCLRTYSRADLPRLVESIKSMIEDALHPSGEIVFRPSEVACENCPALTYCPAARQAIFELERAIAGLDISGMESPRLGLLYDRLSLLDDLKGAVREELIARLRNGDEAVGYELKTRLGNRYLPDPAEAWKRLGEWISASEFLGCCEVKMGRLDKIVGTAIKQKKGGKYKLKEAAKDMAAALGEALQRKADIVTLVRKYEATGLAKLLSKEKGDDESE